jgi:hypothetical protein
LGGLLLCLWIITVYPTLNTVENPAQEGSIVRGNLTKLLADADVASHQARYTTTDERAYKINTSTQLHDIM